MKAKKNWCEHISWVSGEWVIEDIGSAKLPFNFIVYDRWKVCPICGVCRPGLTAVQRKEDYGKYII